MYLSAAVINVFLNLALIPVLGAAGAALASLITQICTSMVLPLFFKGMRRNTILMLQGKIHEYWERMKEAEEAEAAEEPEIAEKS